MRVHLIDPSGDVLPYDHALAAALARRGVDVELVTSRFVHGPAPVPDGYGVTESFYRLATRFGAQAPRRRRALKVAEHVPDMLRYRRRAGDADVRHFQWLPIERHDAPTPHPVRPRRDTAPPRAAGRRRGRAACPSTPGAGARRGTAAGPSPWTP